MKDKPHIAYGMAYDPNTDAVSINVSGVCSMIIPFHILQQGFLAINGQRNAKKTILSPSDVENQVNGK